MVGRSQPVENGRYSNVAKPEFLLQKGLNECSRCAMVPPPVKLVDVHRRRRRHAGQAEDRDHAQFVMNAVKTDVLAQSQLYVVVPSVESERWSMKEGSRL